jgi:uncharacterized RmlC-like cupin family protein
MPPAIELLRPREVETEGKKHADLISTGLVQPLHHVPFHANGIAPLTRRVMAGADVHPQLNKHLVTHELRNVSAGHRAYCEPHVHNCAEINILLSMTHLSYEIRLEDEIYIVQAPATIYIPAGLVHSANVLEGTGFFLAMLETADYAASVSAAKR